MSVITVELKDHVAIVRLAKPEKFNAMGKAYFQEMREALTEIQDNERIKALIISSEGAHFSTGLDLSELSELATGLTGGSTHRQVILFERIQQLQAVTKILANFKIPSIATVSGYCLGGGVDLIAACSIRLCSRDSIFSIRETKIAITADLGSLQLLPSIIPRGALYELALTVRDFNAIEAKEIHFVNQVFKDKQATEEYALELANEIACNSTTAVQGTKRILDSMYNRTLLDDLEKVALWNTAFLNQDDINEVVEAFSEKRKPKFT